MIEACGVLNATFPITLPRPASMHPDACAHSTRQSRVVYALFNTSGTFVEFGGNDGLHESNTRFLECKGWRGALVEPLRSQWRKSCVNRPRAVSVRSAICPTHGVVNISIPGSRTAASGILRHMSQISVHTFIQKSTVTTERVPCRPLASLVSQNQCVDYLSADAEGAEWSILKDYPFQTACIHVISVEMHASSRDRNLQIAMKLKANGFHLFKTVPVWNMHIADEIYVNSTFYPEGHRRPLSWLRRSRTRHGRREFHDD